MNEQIELVLTEYALDSGVSLVKGGKFEAEYYFQTKIDAQRARDLAASALSAVGYRVEYKNGEAVDDAED